MDSPLKLVSPVERKETYSSPEAESFSSRDCVRHFELEKLLSFTFFQMISWNITGDSEYK